MKLSKFYKQAIKISKDYDPRGKSYMTKKFSRVNPYADSQILYSKGDPQIKDILVGIDIESAELALADRLREKNGLDLVVTHHPEGKALLELYKVMSVQSQMLKNMGMQEDAAVGFLNERIHQVQRRLLGSNHMRSVDTARLLNIPFICLHTAADNFAYYFIQQLMQKEQPKKVQDIIDLLSEVPEYKLAAKETTGPTILLGSRKRKVGKILVEMTGGTEGSKDVFSKLYETGVRTLICMHLSEEHFRRVKSANLNVVIAGHISSDNLGLNLLLDRIDKKRELNVTACSGFRRVIRRKS